MRNLLRKRDIQKAKKEDYIALLDLNTTPEGFVVTWEPNITFRLTDEPWLALIRKMCDCSTFLGKKVKPIVIQEPALIICS